MCVQSSWPSFDLLCEEYSFPPSLSVTLLHSGYVTAIEMQSVFRIYDVKLSL
jgi:hypothetical protein